MKNLNECFNANKCDKGSLKHRYDRVYEPALQHLRDKEFTMLEIGVFKGSSLQSWLDYFPKATIYAADIFVRVQPKDIPALRNPRVKWVKCDSTDAKAVKECFESPVFDVIIDDGLHTFDAQRKTFNNFYPFLAKEVGLYFIEDIWPYHLMTDEDKTNRWIVEHQNDFSDKQYHELLVAMHNVGTVIHHDLRQGYNPDTFITEVRQK